MKEDLVNSNKQVELFKGILLPTALRRNSYMASLYHGWKTTGRPFDVQHSLQWSCPVTKVGDILPQKRRRTYFYLVMDIRYPLTRTYRWRCNMVIGLRDDRGHAQINLYNQFLPRYMVVGNWATSFAGCQQQNAYRYVKNGCKVTGMSNFRSDSFTAGQQNCAPMIMIKKKMLKTTPSNHRVWQTQ